MCEEVPRPGDLYAVPPERFTATRQALVAALRQGGDRRGAAEAAVIKRPTLPLWAINRLARDDQAVVTGLIEAAESLKMAQLGRRAGGDLREASETYQQNYRGDNSYETDMARPFRISHRGGRGRDFDRSVSVR
jgi:hypothetical protein